MKQHGSEIQADVTARLCDVTTRKPVDEALTASFSYTFRANRVTITARLNSKRNGVRFVLPIIKNSVSIQINAPYQRRDIFFLTGGFGADEYTFDLTEQPIIIEIGG